MDWTQPQNMRSSHLTRIAIVATGLGHVSRGVEAWADDLARALHDRGANVTLFKGGGTADADYQRVIPCFQRGGWKNAALRRCLPPGAWRLGLGNPYDIEQTTFALRLIRSLRRGGYRILHTQDPMLAVIVTRLHRLGLVDCHVILTHGTEEPSATLRKLEHVLHGGPSHLAEALIGGASGGRWSVVPNFIDTETFRPGSSSEIRDELGIDRDAVVVMTSAAVRRFHKRIDYLIEEFATLLRLCPDRAPVLLIAGAREKETDELVELAQRRLGRQVRFVIQAPRVRMPELYRAADLFVLCSLKEMMPMAVLEATAAGLPCVVHHHPVLKWMVGPGGIAADLSTAGALAQCLAPLVSDADRRADLGARARGHCQELFSIERVVNRILEEYATVAPAPVVPVCSSAASVHAN